MFRRSCIFVCCVVLVFLANAPNCPAAVYGLGAAADYAVLGLENGTVIVNSATVVNGDFGYSNGVTSTTNQKIGEDYLGQWTGTAYVHSGATFAYTDKNYIPSGGIVTNPTQDARLDQANQDALDFWQHVSGLTPTISLGAVNDTSVTLGSVNGLPDVNVVQVSSLNMNSDVLNLIGDPGDYFLFNMMGNFSFSDSEVQLSGGLTAATVLFNFPQNGTQTTDVVINKSSTVFNGTILAPDLDGNTLIYHNPAAFNGAIIASDINLHSDFNLNQIPFQPIPEPGAIAVWSLLSGMGIVASRWRKRRAA